MPVALSTGVREDAEREPSLEMRVGTTSATGIRPVRAAVCTSLTSALIVAWLRRSPAAMTSGRARRRSVRGMDRRGSDSTIAPPRCGFAGGSASATEPVRMAEADGNRTRQTEMLGLTGFEDRGAHQDADASTEESYRARLPSRARPSSSGDGASPAVLVSGYDCDS